MEVLLAVSCNDFLLERVVVVVPPSVVSFRREKTKVAVVDGIIPPLFCGTSWWFRPKPGKKFLLGDVCFVEITKASPNEDRTRSDVCTHATNSKMVWMEIILLILVPRIKHFPCRHFIPSNCFDRTAYESFEFDGCMDCRLVNSCAKSFASNIPILRDEW